MSRGLKPVGKCIYCGTVDEYGVDGFSHQATDLILGNFGNVNFLVGCEDELKPATANIHEIQTYTHNETGTIAVTVKGAATSSRSIGAPLGVFECYGGRALNFHGVGAEKREYPESPQLFFFDRARRLADRETLSFADQGSDDPFSPHFALAIGDAKRVWIVDRFLASERDLVETLFLLITAADVEDARVLTTNSSSYDEVVEIAASYNTASRRRGRIVTRTLPSRAAGSVALPHDRFAIVDGILWHWGATVGGGYNGQNACSHGWSAVRTRAIAWFEELWNFAR